MLHKRHFVMDFLQPIVPEAAGIFINKQMLKEGFDFEVFIRPFAKLTWVAIFGSSLVTSVFIAVVLKWSGSNDVSLSSTLSIFTTTLRTNLGSASFESFGDKFVSMKAIFFTTLLMGNVVWMSYNGALLSELIVHKVVKPFYNWESFLDSLQKLNTDTKDYSTGSLFAESEPNTIYRAIFEKSMDESSFNPPYESMKRTVTNVNHAYYGEVYGVLAYKDISCKVRTSIL